MSRRDDCGAAIERRVMAKNTTNGTENGYQLPFEKPILQLQRKIDELQTHQDEVGRDYSAQDAFDMGMVNEVVPHAELEATALEWARKITTKSPTAQKMLKYAFNLPDEGIVGQQLFAGEATRLAYGTDEAEEGRNAFLEKRDQDYSRFPWQF